MFGYIRYSRLDMTLRDLRAYKAFYCGLCKTIKRNYGEISRLTVNYDIVFIGVLLTVLNGNADKFSRERCILHPLQKKRVILNQYLEYCSHINTFLVYHKLLDDYIDNQSTVSFIKSKIFFKSYKKAKDIYPQKAKIFEEGLEKIHSLEKAYSDQKLNDNKIHEISNVFGDILGELFVYDKDNCNANILRSLGFNLGKLIYILDSVDDLPEDIKRHRFNPLKDTKSDEDKVKICELVSALNKEIAKLSETLKMGQGSGIVKNITSIGLQNRSNRILSRRVYR